MARKSTREIELKLTVDDKGTVKIKTFGDVTQKSFKKASDSTISFTNNAKGLNGVVKTITGTLASMAVVAGTISLAHFVKENLEAADAIGKTADKIGFTTSQLQELRFAAEQSGVGTSTLDMALQRFSRRVGEVAQGTGELLKTAQLYNVKLTDSESRMRSNMEIMEDWADVIKNAKSEQEALRIAFKLFDSEGAVMVNLLRQGSAGMNILRQEAQDLGIVLDEDVIRNAEHANDQLNKLSRVLTAQFQQAIVAAAPQIAKAAQVLTDFIVDTSKAIQEFPMAKAAAWAELMGGIFKLVLFKDTGGLIDFVKNLDKHLKAIEEEEHDKYLRAMFGDSAKAARELASEAGKTGQVISKALDPSAGQKLQKAFEEAQQTLLAISQGEVAAKIAAEDAKLAALKKALGQGVSLTAEQKTQMETIEAAHLVKITQLHAAAAKATQKIWSDAEWDYLQHEAKRFENTEKMLDLERDAALEMARLARDTRKQKELELAAYEKTWRDRGLRGLELERLVAAKRVDINKTSLQRMLEDWADLTEGWSDIGKNFLENFQSEFASTLKNVFEGAESAWDGLWESFKNIAYQAIAAIATKLASGLVANLVLNIMGSNSGGGSLLSGLFNNNSGGLNLGGMLNSNGINEWIWSNFGGGPSIGDANYFPGGVANGGMQWNTLWGGGGFGVGNAMGIAGGLWGMYNAYKYGGGGAMGIAGGAMSGAMAGTSIMPGWGTLVGAIVGGLAGALGGEDDSADREADAQAFRDLAEKIANREGTQQDYMEAIKYAHRSDNRVGGAAMEQLYAMAKAQGLLDWWAPTPGQLGDEKRRGYTEDQWKRFQVYGGTEKDQLGAMGFGELFGGAGKGGWGGGDNWGKVKNVMEGLSEETIEKLGSSMGTLKDLATEWGVSIQDLLGPLIDADLADESWKEALENLSAATLVQNAADAERKKGLDELTIASNAVARSISLMAGWNDMEKEGKADLIKQLQKDAGRRDELMAASARLQEVEELLTGAHKLSEEQVMALAQEYADLSEKLGLNDTAAADAASAASDFAKVMMDEVIPALRDALELGDHTKRLPTEHTGGWLHRAHGGSWLSEAMRAGLITESGGSLQRAHTGLWMGRKEVPFIGLEDERVLSHVEIRNIGGKAMVDLLASGALQVPKATPPRPSGGDAGRPVVINFNPRITVNAPNGADKAAIKAAVAEALKDKRVELKRQFDQTTFAVRR